MAYFYRGIIGSLCLGITACGASHPKPGIVAQNWANNTEQLGVKAIYPPRAGMEVGDVYIVRSTVQGIDLRTEDYANTSIWFDRVDLKPALVGNAPSIKFTSSSKIIDSAGQEVFSWRVPDLQLPSGSGPVKINNLVAFPGFTFASADESEIGVNVATSAIGAVFGGGRKSSYTVAYSVPAAESYGVPYLAARKAFPSYHGEDLVRLRQAADSIRDSSPSTTASAPVMVLITELYLARVLDVVINSSDTSGAQFSLLTASIAELGEKKQAIEDKLLALSNSKVAHGDDQAISEQAAPPEQAPAAVATPAIPAKPAPAKIAPALQAEAKADGAIDIAKLQSERELVMSQIRDKISQISPSMPGFTGSVVRSSATGVTLRQRNYIFYPCARLTSKHSRSRRDVYSPNSFASCSGDASYTASSALIPRETFCPYSSACS
jgi:hypothetical protein